MNKKAPWQWFIVFLSLGIVIFGFCTVIYSSYDLNITAAEKHYVRHGPAFLEGDFKETVRLGHPPLSIWLGALAARLAPTLDTLIAYRSIHSLLYLLAGLCIYSVVLSYHGVWPGLFFATFIGLDPTLKAMSALHMLDSDVAWLLGLSAVWFYVFLRRTKERDKKNKCLTYFIFGLGIFFYTLAINSKYTAWLYAPFVGVVAYLGVREWSQLRVESRSDVSLESRVLIRLFTILTIVGLFAFLTAIWIAWRGDLSAVVEMYFQGLLQQVGHNQEGHPSVSFGQFRETGVWYYFLGLIIFKTPKSLLFLLGILFACWIYSLVIRDGKRKQIRNKYRVDPATILFLLPFVWILIFLSAGNIHINYRYLLIGMLLLWIGLPVLLAPNLKHLVKRGWGRSCIVGLIILGIGEDVLMLRSGSYLTYFNELVPTPNLSFSGNDLNAGIPKHLAEDYAVEKYEPFKGTLAHYIASEREKDGYLILSGNNLAGSWAPNSSPLLRAFVPKESVAGYLLYELTRNDWFRLLNNRRYPPRSVSDHLWKMDPIEFRRLSEPLVETPVEKVCSRRVKTHALRLSESVKKANKSELRIQNAVSSNTALFIQTGENNFREQSVELTNDIMVLARVAGGSSKEIDKHRGYLEKQLERETALDVKRNLILNFLKKVDAVGIGELPSGNWNDIDLWEVSFDLTKDRSGILVLQQAGWGAIKRGKKYLPKLVAVDVNGLPSMLGRHRISKRGHVYSAINWGRVNGRIGKNTVSIVALPDANIEYLIFLWQECE